MNESHRTCTLARREQRVVDFVVFHEADPADRHLALVLATSIFNVI